MNLLQAKHGLVIGKGGCGKTVFMKNLMTTSEEKCIFISIHDDDFGDIPALAVREPVDLGDLRNRFREYLVESFAHNVSFAFRIASGYVGHLNTAIYYNELLLLILSLNKDFAVILDDAIFVAQGDFTAGYRAILEQKNFSVISLFQVLSPETEYVLDFAEQIYIFQLWAREFEYLEKRSLLSRENPIDLALLDQKVGEFRIISR